MRRGPLWTPVADRLWQHVEKTAHGCWLWGGVIDSAGYGRIGEKKPGDKCRTYYAHRLAYESAVGPIPDGLQLDHLCRNRACCNPDHLEPVTSAENTRRSQEALGIRAYATQCKRGHDFTPDNTYEYTDHKGYTRRQCRTCRSAKMAAFRSRAAARRGPRGAA